MSILAELKSPEFVAICPTCLLESSSCRDTGVALCHNCEKVIEAYEVFVPAEAYDDYCEGRLGPESLLAVAA